jgi:hypothetical protein
VPRTPDTYSAAQAAQILGVSERRVRQLVSQGALLGDRADDGTVRIPQQAVNDERNRRKSRAASRGRRQPLRAPSKRAADKSVDVDSLADAVANAVGQRLEGQLEITRRAESLVRQELDEERVRRLQLEHQLEEAQAKLAQLQQAQSRKRGLFRRS